MSANALLLCVETPLITIDAADFDGTNDYMLRGAGLTGAADSKTGIFSCWYRIDGDPARQKNLLASNQPGFIVEQNQAEDKIYIIGYNASGSTLFGIGTSVLGVSATWLHILSSWDMASGTTHLYLNDVSDKTVINVPVNDNIDYTRTNWAVSADTPTFSQKVDGCLAELYFAPGQYLDLSITENRRKFISATGKPVHLGVDGSLPTGTAPIVYLHLDNGEAVANFATNRGTGGNFTITGTLDTASTSPSD